MAILRRAEGLAHFGRQVAWNAGNPELHDRISRLIETTPG
jgi:hypothetical protein